MNGDAASGIPVMRYQSENFTLDTDDYSLTRNGINHPIEPQVFDLLVYLIENRTRVVTREELLEHLWNGRIVSDSAINARLKQARKAVGDTGKQQRVIKTHHRRGYQFIADVSATSSDAVRHELHASGSSSKTEKPSIAVLRFNNLSNDPEQAYFAQGMTINICSRLARIRSLKVKSGMKYDLNEATLADVARDLEVRYVLSGSVQREADHVRVFVELTEGACGDIRWTEHFDRRGEDVIDIQDDIAQAITGTLWSNRGTIREAERDRLARKPTSDFNAFDYILKGMSYKEQYKAEALAPAHECFDRAIELDPDSAEAYSWKAWVYILERFLGSANDKDESLHRAIATAKKSVAIDPYSDGGHWALAEAYSELGDYERALSELDKAMEINPNNPDLVVSKGLLLCTGGKCDEGLELIQQAMEFNKHIPEWYFWHQGIALFASYRWQEAIDALIRMDEQNKDTLTFLCASYLQAGRPRQAMKCLEELLSLDPGFAPGEIEKTHAYLARETLRLLVDGIGDLMTGAEPREKLKIVKN